MTPPHTLRSIIIGVLQEIAFWDDSKLLILDTTYTSACIRSGKAQKNKTHKKQSA